MSDLQPDFTASPYQILGGHALELLRRLPDRSVHLVVTSPPYYGARDYGTDPVVWDGDPDCEHAWEALKTRRENGGGGRTEKQRTNAGSFVSGEKERVTYSDTCARCGALRCELGQEPTLALFIEHLVVIFREVRRVLRKDGTLFLNMGDVYAGSWGAQGRDEVPAGKSAGQVRAAPQGTHTGSRKDPDLKPKDAMLVPHRLALALQADGWYCRADIQWWKVNPMPESQQGWSWQRCRRKVLPGPEWEPCPGCPKCEPHGGLVLIRDSWRPTKAHEHVLYLARSEQYYGDPEPLREPHAAASLARQRRKRSSDHKYVDGGPRAQTIGRDMAHCNHPNGSNARSWWKHEPAEDEEQAEEAEDGADGYALDAWEISTGGGYRGKHYAAMPEELARRCILAGTPEYCCARCGAPYARQLERGEPDRAWQKACGANRDGTYHGADLKEYDKHGAPSPKGIKERTLASMRPRITLGWLPTCRCREVGEPVPPVVLDPFLGSGTTLAVAVRLGRRGLGLEVKDEYRALAESRLAAELAQQRLPLPPPPALSPPPPVLQGSLVLAEEN